MPLCRSLCGTIPSVPLTDTALPVATRLHVSDSSLATLVALREMLADSVPSSMVVPDDNEGMALPDILDALSELEEKVSHLLKY